MASPHQAPAGANPQDLSHLNVLAILHYIWGGLGVLFSLFFVAYFLLGLAMSDGELFGERDPEMKMVGNFMMFLGGGLFCIGEAAGILNIIAGRRLHQQRNRVFCLVIAGLNCLSIPLGTALGIFTIIVLSRWSVRDLFEGVDRSEWLES